MMVTVAVGWNAAAHARDDTVTLDVIEVGTALKLDAPMAETPRPVSTVDREELEERNVQHLDETFRYRAGVRSGHYGADNDTDWLKVRGFDHATYQDGLRVYREGYYQWLPEPYGLERVDVLKGPSSILYGEAPPGGLINAISKRPTAESRGRLDLQAGNREHRQLGIDTSGPLGDDGDVRYRLVGTYKYREGDIDHTENERFYLAPSLEIDLTNDTMLTLRGSVQHDDAVPVNAFKLPYGTVEDTPFGKVDPSTNLGEPGYERNDREQYALGYELRHFFNDTWSFEQRTRYNRMYLDLRSVYASAMVNAREASRGLVYRDGATRSWTTDNRLTGYWSGSGFENTLLLGVDYQDLETEGDEADLFSFGSPIDIFDPVYGNFTPVSGSQLEERRNTREQLGLYAQNQLVLAERWILLGGARFDEAETTTRNRTTGASERAEADELSLSGGLMYRSAAGVNPYLSYQESFEPVSGVDSSGDLYEPREGRQWELGVKVAPPGWNGYLTAAAFDLREDNTLISDGSGRQVQAGERTSTGFELETVGYLTDRLQATFAYTYTDARQDESASQQDQRAPLIPRHQASAWLDYTFTGDTLDGLKLGGGIRYVGETEDGDTQVPDYAVADAMARYDLSASWYVQVNVNNVTDKEYVASCEYWCYYGESRSVTASTAYRW